MAKPLPLDKPTRRSIESLFRELLSYNDERDNTLHNRYQELDKELEELKDKLLSCKKYKALERRVGIAYRAYSKKNSAERVAVSNLRKYYQVNGITKKLIADLNKLIKS